MVIYSNIYARMPVATQIYRIGGGDTNRFPLESFREYNIVVCTYTIDLVGGDTTIF